MAYPPIGLDVRNGQKYVDGDGIWFYSGANTTCVGQYKNPLSSFNTWGFREHAHQWIIYGS